MASMLETMDGHLEDLQAPLAPMVEPGAESANRWTRLAPPLELAAEEQQLLASWTSALGRSCEPGPSGKLRSLATYVALRRRGLHAERSNTSFPSSTELFGPTIGSRAVRIMATLDSALADDLEAARRLLKSGMDCGRILCDHDGPKRWSRVIANLRKASRETGRPFRLCLDVSHPRPHILEVATAPESQRIGCGAYLLLTSRKPRLRQGLDAALRVGLEPRLPQLAAGAEVAVDGGRLIARVIEADKDGALLKVTSAPPRGVRLKPHQRLHFHGADPPPLADEDREELRFIAEHADLVGTSRVQCAADLLSLQQAIIQSGRLLSSIGLILNISAACAVRSLPAILACALGRQPVGVLLSSSDLAVELGYEPLAEVQNEVVKLCVAAQVPVLFTHPLLDRLVRKGTASPCELADVTYEQRIDCVRLGAGRYLGEAVRTLDELFAKLHLWRSRGASIAKALTW